MSGARQNELAMASWIREESVRCVMEAIGGDRGEARFVGGMVRNALLNEPVVDIDIATIHRPEEVMARLEKVAIKTVPTGIAHGTVTAFCGERQLEITTLRVDAIADGRHADVEFIGDWVEDAKRRDFTMNALYVDLDGTVHDPLNGREDIKTRTVRFIGDAGDRIREDYLRILRFFRFAAEYGGGILDEAGLRACAAHKAGLARLSGERVRMELLKILAASDSPGVLQHMAVVGILADVLPEAVRMERFKAVVEIETNQLFVSDAILRLGALVDPGDGDIHALAARLKLSNKDRDRLVRMYAHDTKTRIVSYLSMREVRRALYRMGVGAFKDRVMLGWASDEKASNGVQWRALLAMADSWEKPSLPLTGQMVRAAGVPEGPDVGRVMKEVEDWWIDADFIEDEFSLIERMKAVVQATVC